MTRHLAPMPWLVSAALTFPLAFSLANVPIADAADDVCSVTAGTLGDARRDYAARCTLPRVDCDPVGGGWVCSSESIGRATSGLAPLATAPAPSPAGPAPDEQSPASPDTPIARSAVARDDGRQDGACQASAPDLGGARARYAERCSAARVDCDAVGDRWTCASYRIGLAAPGQDAFAGGGNAPSPASGTTVSEAAPEAAPEPAPASGPVTGDRDGNGVPDVFETDAPSRDEDGDFVADAFDVDNTGGEDRNANDVDDRFEAALTGGDDADGDGLVDRLEPPPPVDRSATARLPLPAPRRTPLLVVDYESGTLDSGIEGLGPSKAPAAGAFTLDSSTPRSGSFAVAHTVKLADDYRSNGAWRSESDTVRLLDTRYDEGDRVRYMFSTYLAPPWPTDPGNLEIIFQWKRFSSPPDMFVAVVGDEVVFRALHDDRSVRRRVIRDYRVGEWMDFMFDVTWSSRGTGSVDMHFKYANEPNYRRVDTYRGTNMLADGPIDSTYLKWGNYKPLFHRTANPGLERTILHDDIRVIPLD